MGRWSVPLTKRIEPRGSADVATARGMQTIRCALCLALLIMLMPSTYAAALPAESAAGKRLHDANCMGCHNTDIYAREDRIVRSLDALEKQLVGCTHMAKAELSTSEMRDLLKYLNDHFYHFE